MINQRMYELGAAPSAIRELFAYGMERKAQIGEDKVFDFSIGNPSVPAPQEVKDSILKNMERDPVSLHGYTPAPGLPQVRAAIARQIARDFHVPSMMWQIYLTSGAAAALSISISAVCCPGEEVIVMAPFFPEYRVWVEQAGGRLVIVPCGRADFQLDVPAIEAAICDKTAALIINSPNNPVGAIYSRENLEELSAMLQRKEAELGRKIYLISDEPYRLITYGDEVPYVPTIYPRTLVCYSYSKCLSLPGERIGYIFISDAADDARELSLAIAGAGRALGFICASSLFQYMLMDCLNLPTDLDTYAENRRWLTEGLARIGYEFVEPQGAFYLWVKALEPDAKAFSERAKKFELLLVPSDSFGCPGYVRISYCVSKECIINSLPAFEALMEDYKAQA